MSSDVVAHNHPVNGTVTGIKEVDGPEASPFECDIPHRDVFCFRYQECPGTLAVVVYNPSQSSCLIISSHLPVVIPEWFALSVYLSLARDFHILLSNHIDQSRGPYHLNPCHTGRDIGIIIYLLASQQCYPFRNEQMHPLFQIDGSGEIAAGVKCDNTAPCVCTGVNRSLYCFGVHCCAISNSTK